jgi:hypothetical protein
MRRNKKFPVGVEAFKADGDFINLLRQYAIDQRERKAFMAVI